MRNLSAFLTVVGIAASVAYAVQAPLRPEQIVKNLQTNNFETSDALSNDDACPDNAHKVTSIPYWTEGEKFPCNYAGTL